MRCICSAESLSKAETERARASRRADGFEQKLKEMQKALDQAKADAEGYKKKLEALAEESKSALNTAQERADQAEGWLQLLVERMSGERFVFHASRSLSLFVRILILFCLHPQLRLGFPLGLRRSMINPKHYLGM